MSNPFYNNPIQDMYRAMSQSKNPYDMFIKLSGNNPQLQPIVNAIKSGSDPQQIFNDMCQKRGINPQEFLSKFK